MLITQKFIYRSDLQSNPHILYLFGDNLVRQGRGGQAKEMRGEPNAIGVATKRRPSAYADSFFSDSDFEDNCKVIRTDLRPAARAIQHYSIVIIPEDGLGTGFSELPERAPRTNEYLLALIKLMKEFR